MFRNERFRVFILFSVCVLCMCVLLFADVAVGVRCVGAQRIMCVARACVFVW